MMFQFFRNVDPNVETLIEACSRNDIATVQRLIEKQTDINGEDDVGDTGLSQAAFHGHKAIVEFLLTKETSSYSKNHALLLACQAGHIAIIDLLLKKGADFNVYVEGYNTPLFQVIANNKPAALTRLLEEKPINVNLEDKEGKMPLLLAAYNGRFEMVKQLVEHGAQTDKANKDGWTASSMAKLRNHTQIIEYLKTAKKNESEEMPSTSFCN